MIRPLPVAMRSPPPSLRGPSRVWYRVPALVAGLMLSGCGVVCKGPGCEDDWPATRVVIHRGDDLLPGARDAWLTADAGFDGRLEDGAGWSVDAYGDLLAFGQPETDRVVVVPDREDGGTFAALTDWTDGAGTRFGASIALDDFDGDELFDLWVGAPDRDEARGAAVLFRAAQLQGGADADAASLTVIGGSPGDRFGTRLVQCADMTGDGLPEIAITAPWLAPNGVLPDVPPLAGGVFLVHSEAARTIEGTVPAWELGETWWGELPGAGAGHAVTCDRDLTGDGVPDLAVGAPWYNDATGRVYILTGRTFPPSGPLDVAAARILEAPSNGEWFGSALVALELDGTDPAELAVGAPGYDGGRGRVHVYPGRELAQDSAVKQLATIVPAEARAEADHVGRSLARADFDGDGLDDLLVGAPDYREGANGFGTGRAWIWLGAGAADWPLTFDTDAADVTLTGAQPFQRIGRDPWTGDLDGDGFDDLVLPTRTAPQ